MAVSHIGILYRSRLDGLGGSRAAETADVWLRALCLAVMQGTITTRFASAVAGWFGLGTGFATCRDCELRTEDKMLRLNGTCCSEQRVPFLYWQILASQARMLGKQMPGAVPCFDWLRFVSTSNRHN